MRSYHDFASKAIAGQSSTRSKSATTEIIKYLKDNTHSKGYVFHYCLRICFTVII